MLQIVNIATIEKNFIYGYLLLAVWLCIWLLSHMVNWRLRWLPIEKWPIRDGDGITSCGHLKPRAKCTFTPPPPTQKEGGTITYVFKTN